MTANQEQLFHAYLSKKNVLIQSTFHMSSVASVYKLGISYQTVSDVIDKI